MDLVLSIYRDCEKLIKRNIMARVIQTRNYIEVFEKYNINNIIKYIRKKIKTIY